MPNSERMGIPIGAVLDEDKTDQYLGAETDVSYPRSFKNHSTLIDDLKACFGPNCPPYRRKGAGRTMAERLANEEYEASNVSELIDSMTELIFNYMPEEKAVDHERVKALAEVTDKSELLNSLKSMTLTERLSYLMINNPRGYDYLKRRLNYYYRFSRNQVTKTDYEQYYNDAKGEWESRPKKIKLHFDGDWEAVKRGLLRDSLYAAMIGSPELASWKMAMTKTDGHVKSDFPVLRGFESGINEDSIGDWEVLIDEYQKLATRIAKRHPELTDEELEAKQVRQIADIFAESTYYNPHDRTRGSSYVGLFPEAVAWAQLGEGAKNQLWGMRNKIEGSDLWNIGRFIGKSGDSVKSFLSEQRYLQYKTDLLQNSPESEEAQEFLAKENAEALRRAGRWYEREKKKIDKWYQKSLRKIASYEIAVAEKEQIQRKVETQLAEKLQWLDNEYRTEQAHLENRQTDELLQVLQARQKKVADKIEKHTNLATKAIDLHFASRNEEVDWINQIPFSLIKKAHRRLYEEESITDIIQDTFRAIYAGVVTDPENINDTIINNSHLDYYERKNLLTIASKLYGSDKKYSCSQLISMKDYARMWFSQRNERRAWKSEHFEQNVGQICTQYDNDYDRVKQNIAPEKLDLIFSKGISLLGLVELMNQGLENVDLIVNYSWLANEYRQGEKYAQAANEFPLYKSDNAKYNWCAKNAFVYLDGDWGRATIGKIIFTRLQTGIENNLHDASQWLQTFQMPEQTYNIPALKEAIKNGESVDNLGQFRMTLYNQSEELKFLWNVLQAPLELRARINLSRKQQAISGLFASPESMLIYDELVKIYRDDDCSWEKLQEMVKAEINNFYLNNIQNPNGKPSQWRMSIDEFSQKVQQALIQLNQLKTPDNNQANLSELMTRLKQYGKNRKLYIDDASAWLEKHIVTPSSTLTKVWGDRALALANGVSDRATEIAKWQKQKALFVHIQNNPGILDELNLKKEELYNTYKSFVEELSRVYDAEQILRGVALYKVNKNPEKLMPMQVIDLETGKQQKNKKQKFFKGIVLAHDDPRGMTIGPDTGCCMTINGVSESCIASGYSDKEAGFFALYDPDGQLMAQSYFYINPNRPDVVIMDNIEANQGRDFDKILKLYQQFFREYFLKQFADNPDWQVRQVNIGEGYTDVSLQDLERVDKPILNSRDDVYSDAHRQRFLFRLSDEEIAKVRQSKQEPVKEAEPVEVIHKTIEMTRTMGLNQLPILQSLEAQLYPENMRQYDDEDFAESELSQPGVGKYSFLIEAQTDANRQAVGYCLAYEAESETDPQYPDKVVYIADFGIVPEAQKGNAALKGLNELLKRLQNNNVQKVELDARESTSYKFFKSEAGQRYLARHGYQVKEYDTTTDFGEGEKTYMLSLEKTDNKNSTNTRLAAS